MDYVRSHNRDGEPWDTWYDELYDGRAEVGDYRWSSTDGHGTLLLLVPDLLNEGQAPGVEILLIYPSHAENNWASPGPINGWDGNIEYPTLSPSILVQSGEPGRAGTGTCGQVYSRRHRNLVRLRRASPSRATTEPPPLAAVGVPVIVPSVATEGDS